MVLLIANKGIFMHTHKVDDNTYIMHSHPYNKESDSEPLKSHHHTKAEFIFLQNIEILFPLFFLTVAITPGLLKSYLITYTIPEYEPSHLFVRKGRAPPLSIQ
jgi:hypothetical protein